MCSSCSEEAVECLEILNVHTRLSKLWNIVNKRNHTDVFGLPQPTFSCGEIRLYGMYGMYGA